MIDQQTILDRFQKGEISISKAFNLLTEEDREKIKKVNIVKKNGLEELHNLVGLNNIKGLIEDLTAFLQVQNLREKYHLKSNGQVNHMIFSGNPGTGKTTVARILSTILYEIGLLKSNKFTEVERADLVGEYIGHTAQKTKKIINKAMGGILFIDEAYSLARGDKRDFGQESIDTIVKSMEDYKENIVIILAGYKDEMQSFIDTNPGLASRFAIKLNFPDYTIEQLVKISEKMFRDREYILSDRSKHYIYRVITELRNKEEINSNARMVRNLAEKAIRNQARRIVKKNRVNKIDLMTINTDDLIRGLDNA